MPNVEQDDASFFKARGFGLRMGFGQAPALLVIDMVNAFTDPDAPLGSDMSSQIEAVNALSLTAHEAEVPVIFSTVSYGEPDAADSGIWHLKQSGVRTLIETTRGPDVDERLAFRSGDILLKKKYASCFFGTDLLPRLVAKRIDTLILTGGTTSGCVRSTAVDALQNGFRPIIVREAVADRSKAAHDQSLFDLDQKYGDVVALDDVITYLETLSR